MALTQKKTARRKITFATTGRIDFDALARFDLTGGEIKNAVVAAVADAVRRAGKKAKIRQDDLVTAAVECAPVVRRAGFARG